jgi:hypothetical protein
MTRFARFRDPKVLRVVELRVTGYRFDEDWRVGRPIRG